MLGAEADSAPAGCHGSDQHVLFDTNVLLDVLAEREPFYDDSAAIWTMAEVGKVGGCVSVLSHGTAASLLSR